jgi:nucleotide-binding universal stress UspA family protein
MEWKPKVVVAAVDGSEASLGGARTAAAIARQNNARMVLVTAVRPPEGWWGMTGEPPSPHALSEALLAGQQRVMDSAIGEIDLAGIDHSAVVQLGDPTAEIIAVCEQENADLLVIGRRGAGLVERMVIGSVADRLAHHAPCPLLIVP